MGESSTNPTALLGRRLGAAHGWIVRARGADEVVDALGLRDCRVAVLGGTPIGVAPIRAMARSAHARDELLACDNSLSTSALCAPCQQGADVTVESLDLVLGEGCGLVGIFVAEGVDVDLAGLELADDLAQAELGDALAGLDERMRSASDAAQELASYLACHPRVHALAYPGLKSDASFATAATTLHHGFGAFVDYRLRGELSWRRISCLGTTARAAISSLEREM